MIRVLVFLLVAAIGVSCALAVDRLRIQLNAANAVILNQNKALEVAREDLEQERLWANTREGVIKAMLEISKDMETIRITLRTQDQAHRKALKELIENDKEVRAYMALSIPDPLGLQYARPETTDPTEYRSSGSVPSGQVPATSKSPAKVK